MDLLKQNNAKNKNNRVLLLNYLSKFDYTKEELDLMYEKLNRYKLFDIIKYLSIFGYINDKSDEKHNLDTIKELENGYPIDNVKIQQIINNKKCDKYLIDFYKDKDLSIINKIEQLGFKPTISCMNGACIYLNLDTVIHLLNNGFNVSDNNIEYLFNVISKKIVIKRNGVINKRYNRFRRNHISYLYYDYKNKKLPRNYGTKMIDIIKKLNGNNIIKIKHIIENSSINKFVNHTNLLKYIINEIKPNINLSGKEKDKLINILILNDDLEVMKQFIEFKIIKIVDIAQNNKYLDTAIKCKVFNIVKYFIEELKMICDKIHYALSSYSWTPRIITKEQIKWIEQTGYPIYNRFLKICIKFSNLECVKYLLDEYKYNEDLTIAQRHVDLAICYGKFKMATYLMSKVKRYVKKNLLDRVLKLHSINRMYYIYSKNVGYKKIIHFVKKIGGTATNKSAELICKSRGANTALITLHQQFGILPDKKNIICLNRRYYDSSSENIAVIKYFINEGLNLFDNPDQIEEMYKRILCMMDIEFVKLFLNTTGYKIQQKDLTYLCDVEFWFHRANMTNQMKFINYIFNMYDEQNIIIKKEDIMGLLYDNRILYENIYYLFDRYKFKITNKEFNTMINFQFGNNFINEMLKYCEEQLTPYTIKLFRNAFDYYFTQKILRWNGKRIVDLFCKLIGIVKKIPRDIYDRDIKNNNEILLSIYHKCNAEIVEYIPQDNEQPDNMVGLHIYGGHKNDEHKNDDGDINNIINDTLKIKVDNKEVDDDLEDELILI